MQDNVMSTLTHTCPITLVKRGHKNGAHTHSSMTHICKQHVTVRKMTLIIAFHTTHKYK